MAKIKEKKDKLLYVIVACLFIIMISMFFYFQSKINQHYEYLEVNSKMTMAAFKRLNNVINLNFLDTDQYKYLINPDNWKESLKQETALNLFDLTNYEVEKVIVKQPSDMGPDDLSEYTIIMNIPSNSSFKDFTDIMYKKIKEILVITDNDTSKVESFKEGRGYYDIESFEEATYNNMYYDYMKTMSDGSTGGPKVKIKILFLEETNQIKMEINKF